MNILVVFGPTTYKEDAHVEQFYEQVTLKLPKNHQVKIIMGDFNAKIDKGKSMGCIDNFRVGEEKEHGNRFLQFYQREDLII